MSEKEGHSERRRANKIALRLRGEGDEEAAELIEELVLALYGEQRQFPFTSKNAAITKGLGKTIDIQTGENL